MSYALPSRFAHSFQGISNFDQLISPEVRGRTQEDDATMALDDWSDYYAPPAAPAAAAAGPMAPAPGPSH